MGERTRHSILCFIKGFEWRRTTYFEMVCSECGVKHATVKAKRRR